MAKGINKNWWSCSVKVTAIWFICAVTFCCLFQMALRNSNFHQSTTVSDLFTLKGGTVMPGLKAANPPVRANVLYLRPEYSVPISEAVKSIFSPYLNKAFRHFPMYTVHAILGLRRVCGSKMVSGTDPVTICAKLRSAYPRSPERQLYDKAMLHTSFAGLLGHPNKLSEEGNNSSALKNFHELVRIPNNKIREHQATVSELWYVEEYELLALALN